MAPRRERIPEGERSQLDPFVVTRSSASPRDQRDLMERPFFALAKAKRTVPILYESGSTRIEVFAVPEHGMATIWDADVLIWAASQIVEAENLCLRTSRFLRFTPYQFLTAVGRETGSRDYRLLKGALTRLQSTVVRTSIRNGEHWRHHQFSWINEWKDRTTESGRVEGLEFVLPDWFYRGVIDRSLVLAIDPAYFRLTGGIERWLYRIARKHAGHQSHGWTFEVAHLHEKSASLVRPSDFALQLRKIAVRQPLPGYRLRLERDGRRELLHIQPTHLSTAPVDKAVEALGTSHASTIGISHAALSGLCTQESGSTDWPSTAILSRNLESNKDSNFCFTCRADEETSSGRKSRATTPHPTENTRDTSFRKSVSTSFTSEARPPLPFGNRPGGAE